MRICGAVGASSQFRRFRGMTRIDAEKCRDGLRMRICDAARSVLRCSFAAFRAWLAYLHAYPSARACHYHPHSEHALYLHYEEIKHNVRALSSPYTYSLTSAPRPRAGYGRHGVYLLPLKPDANMIRRAREHVWSHGHPQCETAMHMRVCGTTVAPSSGHPLPVQ
jgi:hypothetical protein